MVFGKMPPLMAPHDLKTSTGGIYLGLTRSVNSLLDANSEYARVWGKYMEIDGKKYLVRPSREWGKYMEIDGKKCRIRRSGTNMESSQHVPVISLEVNGQTVELLGLPMRSMICSVEQERQFKEAGGKVVDYITGYPNNMAYQLDGDLLNDPFCLRNHAARRWMAEMNGCHLASLNQDGTGELLDIYNAAPGDSVIKKLATIIGQAPMYLVNADASYGSDGSDGEWARLVSGSSDNDGKILGLLINIHTGEVRVNRFDPKSSYSVVIVLNK